ncbi:MAG: hypothetical protein WBA45_00240 [Microthrixaceae bacterium]
MTTRLRSHIKSRLARRGQAGFALIAGLMVWFALCGAVLIALMSMTLNALTIAEQSSTSAEQLRAADSSMEAAVQQIRMDPTGLIGSGNGKCEPGIGLEGAEGLDYQDTLGNSVLVTADCETSSLLTLANDASLNPADLHVVGDRYNSPIELPDTVRYEADCATTPVSTCFPWGEALGAASGAHATDIAALRPTLLHTSDPATDPLHATLSLSGNVRVAGSALGMLKPPTSSATSAISVAGTFNQQALGPLGSAGNGDEACGILSPVSPLSLGSTVISVSEGSTASPSCGSNVATNAAGLRAPTLWTILQPRPQTPACAGAGAVTKLRPGVYTRVATEALNNLMGGSCANSVLWFSPGDYSFDVDDPSNSALERHSLIVDDPTVRVIFGEPAGGDTATAALAATFPKACNPDAPGVSVTLSARTSLRHKQGRVAICDRSVSGARSSLPPALWQTAGASGAAGADGGFSGMADAASSNASACSTQGSAHGCWSTATLRGIDMDGSDPGDTTPVRSLELLIHGTVSTLAAPGTRADPTGTAGEQATVSLFASGAGSPLCAVKFPADAGLAPGASFDRAVDLFSPALAGDGSVPRCVDVRDQLTVGDLVDSRVDTHLPSVEVGVQGFSLRSGWQALAGTATNLNGWVDTQRVDVADGVLATGDPAKCSAGFCAELLRSIQVSNLDSTVDPLTPTDGPLTQAGLIIVGHTSGGPITIPGSAPVTRATLTLAGGSTCSAEWPATPLSPAGVYLDLRGGNGNCATVLTNASQLIGASARIDLFTPATANSTDVGIDQIRLSTVSSGRYVGPVAPNLFTMAANPDGASSTSINIFGPVSIPRATLNVRWVGSPAIDSNGHVVPLIGAQAVIGSIGSSVGPNGTAGVLCCAPTKPAERIVNLKAWVLSSDGARTLMGRARVIISDSRWSNSPVRIVDWRLGPDDLEDGQPDPETPDPTVPPTTSTTTSTSTTSIPPSTTTTTSTSTTSTTTSTVPPTTVPSQPSPATWTMKKRNPDWDGRYCADVTVLNPTSSAIKWIVDIPLEGTLDDFWNGTYDRLNPQTTRVRGIQGQNETLAAGRTTGFGFCVTP